MSNPGDKAKSKAKRQKLAQGLVDTLLEAVPDDAFAEDAPTAPSEPRRTTLGALCAKTWDDQWIATVDTAEQRLGRPICGAHTLAANPCPLPPNHENGRCRFHGGFPLTGAPNANRNAVIHGLYSRRLRRCDDHCPESHQCPCAIPELNDLPDPDRPICPYEHTEYNLALTDALATAAPNPHPDPFARHTAHNVALLQVMLNRAARALNTVDLVDHVHAHSDTYHMETPKPSAYLQAFLRIAAENRRHAERLRPRYPVEPLPDDALEHHFRGAADTGLDPDALNDMNQPKLDRWNQAERYLRHAARHAAAGRDVAMLRNLEDAYTIAPAFTRKRQGEVLAAYRPNPDARQPDDAPPADPRTAWRTTPPPQSPGVLPPDAVQAILNHLRKKPP